MAHEYAEALKWFNKAAEQEDSDAQFSLGYMYEHGLGVTQDYAEAARWYGKGAKQANADAQAGLGDLYANGRGVPQDYILAHMWLNLAGARGQQRRGCSARQDRKDDDPRTNR
jgi:uncharacterized protein